MAIVKRLWLAAFSVFALSIPLLVPQLSSKLMVLLSIIWLFMNPKFLALKKNPLILLVAVLVLMQVIGLIYSRNLSFAFSFIETNAALILLPLILFVSESLFARGGMLPLLLAFVAGVILLNLSSLFFISYDLWDPKNLQSNLIAANNVIVRIHPTFLSMYISFSIFFLVNQYFPLKGQNRTRLGWVMFSLAILFVFLFWLNSRAGILAFVLGSTFFIYFKWKGRARAVGLAGLVLFLLLITIIPFSKHRFIEAPLMVLKGDASHAEGDPSVYPLVTRLQIYKSDLELLKWPEIVYGYGTGDFRDVLQERFAANDFERPLAENMDSHSEYFAQLHRHGIIGLGLFLALLIVPLRHALRHRSSLLGSFIILFAITALFENVFSAQKGVTFFALFCPLLWIYAEQQAEGRKTQTTTS